MKGQIYGELVHNDSKTATVPLSNMHAQNLEIHAYQEPLEVINANRASVLAVSRELKFILFVGVYSNMQLNSHILAMGTRIQRF